ncbi:hypothetical protein V8G54_006610 [Vigna mungo]|uniref:Yippee domain-containing protein n=1 Tax=Vigna mungo TaxID=3915 RepID=A0AAQ3P0S8_VIGMU
MAELIGPRLYCCSNCRNQVSLHDDIISKAFHHNFKCGRGETMAVLKMWKVGDLDFRPFISLSLNENIPKASLYVLIWLFSGRNGRAFLFSHAMNVVTGPKEDRHLLTGLHTVADVYCGDCREVLGWKYERAYEASQRRTFNHLKIVIVSPPSISPDFFLGRRTLLTGKVYYSDWPASKFGLLDGPFLRLKL